MSLHTVTGYLEHKGKWVAHNCGTNSIECGDFDNAFCQRVERLDDDNNPLDLLCGSHFFPEPET